MKVQQELLRHADIRTTMNVYTQAVPDWEKFGADFFIAPRERKGFEQRKAAKAAAGASGK